MLLYRIVVVLPYTSKSDLESKLCKAYLAGGGDRGRVSGSCGLDILYKREQKWSNFYSTHTLCILCGMTMTVGDHHVQYRPCRGLLIPSPFCRHLFLLAEPHTRPHHGVVDAHLRQRPPSQLLPGRPPEALFSQRPDHYRHQVLS